MKLFVDSNIFIDILLARQDFLQDSATIYKLVENGIVNGFVAPITINNIHYICRKSTNQELIKEFLYDIATHFHITPMSQTTIALAKEADITDFEDALQYAMAKESKCGAIITRNIKDFKYIKDINILTPREFLRNF